MSSLGFEMSVAGRYLRSKRRESFISIIAWFSLIGIMLGVATLITATDFRFGGDQVCLFSTNSVAKYNYLENGNKESPHFLTLLLYILVIQFLEIFQDFYR